MEGQFDLEGSTACRDEEDEDDDALALARRMSGAGDEIGPARCGGGGGRERRAIEAKPLIEGGGRGSRLGPDEPRTGLEAERRWAEASEARRDRT